MYCSLWSNLDYGVFRSSFSTEHEFRDDGVSCPYVGQSNHEFWNVFRRECPCPQPTGDRLRECVTLHLSPGWVFGLCVVIEVGLSFVRWLARKLRLVTLATSRQNHGGLDWTEGLKMGTISNAGYYVVQNMSFTRCILVCGHTLGAKYLSKLLHDSSNLFMYITQHPGRRPKAAIHVSVRRQCVMTGRFLPTSS